MERLRRPDTIAISAGKPQRRASAGISSSLWSKVHRPNTDTERSKICGGSSVGPAVGIAAGFSPLGIGTETGGSNIFPASLNGLYGLTLPLGSVPVDGISRIAEFSDRVGLMARDPRDLVSLSTALLTPGSNAHELLKQDESSSPSFKGLSIGVLDSCWETHSSVEWKWGSIEVVREESDLPNQV